MVTPLKFLFCQANIGHGLHHRADSCLSFHAGQGRAQAEMNAVPEPKVASFFTSDVELVWVAELRRVAVRRSKIQREPVSLGYLCVSNLKALQCDPLYRLYRAAVSDHFFDSRIKQRRIIPQ